MVRKKLLAVISLSLILMISNQIKAQSPFDSSLTYQGFLKSKKKPVNHVMDLRFTLFADPNSVQQVGVPLECIDVDVQEGHFTLELDFGGDSFTGEPRWLQTEVRRSGTNDLYEPQLPLLRLMLSPYAIYARKAGSAYALDAPDNSPIDAVVVDNDGNVAIGASSPEAKLSVGGSIALTAGGIKFPDGSLQTTAVSVGNVIPSGCITMWSGAIDKIPTGWVLCDGNNETPDLRNRFIVGATQDHDGEAKTIVKGSLMKIGGEHQHTLTIAEIPKHHHSYQHHPTWRFSGDSEWGGKGNIGNYNTGDTGGDQPHENCPPFFALAFIMKQ